MHKTSSGIPVGAAGAVVYFSALLGGYTPLFILGLLIFLKSDNSWLKKTVFKAAVFMIFFSALIAVVDTLNEFLDIFNSIFQWELEVPLNMDRAVKNAVSILKTVIFTISGFKALAQREIRIPTIDNALGKDGNTPS